MLLNILLNLLILLGNPVSDAALASAEPFTGEQFDNETDNYYLRARYYDPSRPGFTQMDTHPGWQNDPVTLHRYLYANSNPINMIDPSGQFSLGSIGTALNIAGRLATQSVAGVSRIASGFVRGASQIIKTPGLRVQYMQRVRDLSKLANKMKSQGYSSKEIAIKLNKKRLALGRLFKNATPKFLKDRAFKRNLEKYGNKWGPDIKYLREVKHKSWEQIIESASRPSGAIAAFISIFMHGG